MLYYYIAVVGIIIITAILLLYIPDINKKLNKRLIFAIAFCSALTCLLFPEVYRLITVSFGGISGVTNISLVLVITVILSIILTILLSIAVIYAIPDKKMEVVPVEVKETDSADIFADNVTNKLDDEINYNLNEISEINDVNYVNDNTNNKTNYIEEIYNLAVEKENKSSEMEDSSPNVANNLEKSVDSDKNIDKMGLEVSGDTSIEDCIDEAFRLKEQGDLEGAILYYVYALDRKPEKELVFWLVLDICVLYKTLGQVELAQNILTGYVDEYSNFMSIDIINEIDRNLL